MADTSGANSPTDGVLNSFSSLTTDSLRRLHDEQIIESLIEEDMGQIATSFQEHFFQCIEHVQKPNVLVAGVTGSGKCLGRGERLLRSDGTSVAVEHVRVGDCLLGDTGRRGSRCSPRVLSVTHGRDCLYRVSDRSRTGQSFVVNSAHVHVLWVDAYVSHENPSILHVPQRRAELLEDTSLRSIEWRSYAFESAHECRVARARVRHTLALRPVFVEISTTDVAEFVRRSPELASCLWCTRVSVVDSPHEYAEPRPHVSSSDDVSLLLRMFSEDVDMIQCDWIERARATHILLFGPPSSLCVAISKSYGAHVLVHTKNESHVRDRVERLLDSLGVVSKRLGDDLIVSSTEARERLAQPTTVFMPYPFALTQLDEPGEYFGFVLDQNERFVLRDLTVTHNSSLINAIFGSNVAQVGSAMPVTKNYSRFAPSDKPVVVYDSRGLENGRHEEFLGETRKLFNQLRSRDNVAEHIHVVWYVVNAAWARFEEFEKQLIGEVFYPTPVVVLLNKCDIATPEQIRDIGELIESYRMDNVSGVYPIIATRKNYSQTWCPRCKSDDVTFKKTTNQILCDECNAVVVMRPTMGLDEAIEITSALLPDLAKDAFLFSQRQSFEQKDKHARELVKLYCSKISMDVAGDALNEVGEMVSRLFVLWGWNHLGTKVSKKLVTDMKSEYQDQQVSTRIAMVLADTIVKRKLSRSVVALLGMMVNKPLRKLSSELLNMIDSMQEITNTSLVSLVNPEMADYEHMSDAFLRKAFEDGVNTALDTFWESSISSSSSPNADET